MTIYGQNQGYFKHENIECVGTGARTKLHKIKIVVFSTQGMWCYVCTDGRHIVVSVDRGMKVLDKGH